jgi:hypothetical protein
MTTSRPIFLITLMVAIISMAAFFLVLYNGWLGEFIGVGDEFCERMHPGLIKQPANTWSNLAFVFTGLFMAWSLAAGKFSVNHNTLTQSRFYAIFFSCLTVLLGPGSMALHATGTDIGGFCDMLSMYLIASFTLAYASRRLFMLNPWHFILIFSVVLISCIWADGRRDIHIIFGFFGDTAFAFYIGLTILFEILNILVRKLHHVAWWAWISFGTLMLSFFIWGMSLTGNSWCDPDSWIQGHAVWHILDALSIYFLFRYYVSEHKELAV